jgi:phosphatidylserine decarboxylase
VPTGDNIVISPADGKIIDIKEGDESRILKKRMIKISIFMNLFNVHVNRLPCTGKVVDILYNPGKFVSANLEKASLENEQNAVVLETTAGEKIIFIQIAGLIARRIVCWLKKGDYGVKGQRFGLIRFGSRVDVYLPVGADVKVSLGQKVKAGESVLAIMK